MTLPRRLRTTGLVGSPTYVVMNCIEMNSHTDRTNGILLNAHECMITCSNLLLLVGLNVGFYLQA